MTLIRSIKQQTYELETKMVSLGQFSFKIWCTM